jgi:hypothetical protein
MMPHVGWSDASLNGASEFVKLFNIDGDLVKKFTPIVSRLGVAVALQFPVRADVQAIPLAADEVALAAPQPEDVPPSVVVRFEVRYNAQGIPAILGISAQDLLAWGINMPVALQMETLTALQARNVQHMELRSKADGLTLYVNGNALPNIVWDNQMLSDAAEVYAQTNPASPYIDVVKQWVPFVDNLDIGILVHFPLAAGAQPIPAKMH